MNMGLLVEGKWVDKWYDTESTGGKFVRKDSSFRDWITRDGKSLDKDRLAYPAEVGRYHLYVSLACPWAARTLMVRKLKGLEDIVGLSIVSPLMYDKGWSFGDYPGATEDKVHGFKYLHELYTHAKSDYTGRVTVPVLYDTVEEKIVNNESSEIIRIFNQAFDDLGAKEGDFYPEELRSEIDEINDFVYDRINNGVYKAGFATKQEVYEEEAKNVFDALDKIEEILSKNKYLLGDRFTEADIRLFTTLVRFDAVYFSHFKCNLRPLTSYENIWRYTRLIYNMDGIPETVNLDHIKTHYYKSHDMINPNQIVYLGPEIDFSL